MAMILSAMFCWKTLDSGIYVDVTQHKPVLWTPLQTNHTPHGINIPPWHFTPTETRACCHFTETSHEKPNERDWELKVLTCPQNPADPNFHCVLLGCAWKILIHAGPILDQTWVLRPIQTKMTISHWGHQECHKMCCPGLSGVNCATGIVFFCLPFVHSTWRRFNNGWVVREITPIGCSA